MGSHSESTRQFTVEDGWVDNNGVQLHYLESRSGSSHSLLPIVFVPGALGSAENYLKEMASLDPRKCVAISLRGRGKSDAPETGYTFERQVSDVEAVMKKIGLTEFCLMGYSVGVSYAIGFATRHVTHVRGLIIGDYSARYPIFRPEWVNNALTFPGAKAQAVRGIQRDSREVLLWDALERIECPVLVLRGGQAHSLLPGEKAEKYRHHLRNVKIVTFGESGHELSKPDFQKYIGTLREFLEELDSRKQSS